MKTVEVPTGFDFAAVSDLDIDTIGQAEIESAFRLDMPAHHRGWTAVSCRRNCRDNPGCLTFLGEDNWWWAEEEELGQGGGGGQAAQCPGRPGKFDIRDLLRLY